MSLVLKLLCSFTIRILFVYLFQKYAIQLLVWTLTGLKFQGSAVYWDGLAYSTVPVIFAAVQSNRILELVVNVTRKRMWINRESMSHSGVPTALPFSFLSLTFNEMSFLTVFFIICISNHRFPVICTYPSNLLLCSTRECSQIPDVFSWCASGTRTLEYPPIGETSPLLLFYLFPFL